MHAEILMVKKLITVLIAGGKLHEVGGYVYGKTKHGQGDPFVILYPYAQGMKEKVCRVYKHDFNKLPHYIPVEFPEGNQYVYDNPAKEEARKLGIYHNCRPFTMATYPGKQTQMGPEQRFHSVIYEWVGSETQMDPFKIPHKPPEQPSQEPEPELEGEELKAQAEIAKREMEKVANQIKDEESLSEIAASIEEKEEPEEPEPDRDKEIEVVTPPGWAPDHEERSEAMKPMLQALFENGNFSVVEPHIKGGALYYGDKEQVPNNKATYKLYGMFVAAFAKIPMDSNDLKAYYEEQVKTK
jgi:hypothetical protein